MTNGLFEKTASVEDQIPEEIKLEDYIGEGKKWADPAATIKSNLHASRHISQLEREMQELRDELKQRTTLDEIKDLMSRGNQPQPTDEPHREREDTLSPKQMTPEEIEALFEKKRTEWSVAEQKKHNADTVQNKLQEVYGQNYVTKVEERAKELGVGIEFMKDLATSQPSAFLKLMDVDRPVRKPSDPDVFTAPPASQRSSSFAPVSRDRTQTYWDKMRAENKTLYFSREQTVQRHRDAQRLGEAFFDKG